MKKKDSSDRSEPIVVEPDDDIFSNKFFGGLSGMINNFGGGYSEVKSYTSYTKFKNGKLVKKGREEFII
jgi:hypothetical protein